LIEWVRGWVITLDIKFNNPELYRALTQELDGTDFGEVGPPCP
jgi:hypothetical protein